MAFARFQRFTRPVITRWEWILRTDDTLRCRRCLHHPAKFEKTFDQDTRAASPVVSSGALPNMIGGDHSISFPCVRGIAQCTSRRIGIVHFHRHIDIQKKGLDKRPHTMRWFHATELANVPAVSLVQVVPVPERGRLLDETCNDFCPSRELPQRVAPHPDRIVVFAPGSFGLEGIVDHTSVEFQVKCACRATSGSPY